MINKNTDTYKWIVLFLSFMFMTLFALSLQSIPPLFSHIGNDIPLSDSQAGMLMGIYAVPGIFLPLFIGYLATQFDNKLLINIALLIMFTGLVGFAISKSFGILLLFRVIGGIGATILLVLAPMMIAMFFDEKIGMAMGIFNAAVPFGTVIAANLFGPLAELIHWRGAILNIAGLVAITFIVNLIFLYLPEHNGNGDTGQGISNKNFWTNKKIWAVAFIWALTNAQQQAYVTFGPQYYQLIGMNIYLSEFLTSLIMLVPGILGLFMGMIIDRFGRERNLIIIGSVFIATCFLLLAKFTAASTIIPMLIGIGVAPIPVIVYSLAPKIVEPQHIGLAMGLLTSFVNLGISAGPSTFGIILENTNRNFSVGFIILALVSVATIFVSLNLDGTVNRKLDDAV